MDRFYFGSNRYIWLELNLLPVGGGMSIFHPLPVLEQVEFFLTPVFNSDPDRFPELGRDTGK